jgi:hypothetical protein
MLAGAVVGFKADGTRSVLLPAPGESFFSLTTGTVYGRSFTEKLFKKMIRPGDIAAFTDGYGETFQGTYQGVRSVTEKKIVFNGWDAPNSRMAACDVIQPVSLPKKPEFDTETLVREVRERLSQLGEEDLRRLFDESLSRVEKENRSLKDARRPPHCPYDRIVFGTADKTKRLVSVEDLVALVRRMAPLARTIKENLHTDGDVSELINLSFEADELFPEAE